MLAEMHPENAARLATLADYDILDTPSEHDFDEIVALAAQICDAPVSLISLVDRDRQWFKARVGTDIPETGLDSSVCSHALLQEGLFEIGDMAADPRTRDMPIHTGDPNARFYAGVPLLAENGQPLGTLCVLDTRPRQLTAFQRQALTTLSRQVMTLMELRRKLRIETALRAEMDHRVKNSLQTIASLLRLATRQVKDPDALAVLDVVGRRLDAVASLHSELMTQDGRADVEAESYMARLGELLQSSAPDAVRIDVMADAGRLAARRASAVGVIVGEFVANSVKHAFPDGRRGTVTVRLTQAGEGRWLLDCRDDGVGTGQTPGSGVSSTKLGEVLMTAAAQQLDGTVEQDIGADGATLRVAFPA